jgi:hypothetical protein
MLPGLPKEYLFAVTAWDKRVSSAAKQCPRLPTTAPQVRLTRSATRFATVHIYIPSQSSAEKGMADIVVFNLFAQAIKTIYFAWLLWRDKFQVTARELYGLIWPLPPSGWLVQGILPHGVSTLLRV